jgi:hypothetical protein
MRIIIPPMQKKGLYAVLRSACSIEMLSSFIAAALPTKDEVLF